MSPTFLETACALVCNSLVITFVLRLPTQSDFPHEDYKSIFKPDPDFMSTNFEVAKCRLMTISSN
jgi:hypothetical protein